MSVLVIDVDRVVRAWLPYLSAAILLPRRVRRKLTVTVACCAEADPRAASEWERSGLMKSNGTAEVNTPESTAVRAQRRFSVGHQVRKICRMHPERLVGVLVRTYWEWHAEGTTRLGAALAYYTLFSVAPVLIVITGVAGFFVGQAAARAEISPWLQRFLSPDGARAAELMLKQRVTPTGGIVTTIIGVVTLFLATSTFVNELRQAMNLVWKVQTPPSKAVGSFTMIRTMITDRVYGFLIAVGAGILIAGSLAIDTAIGVAGSHFHGSLPFPAPLLQLLNFVFSFLVMTAMFTLVYKTLPDAYVAWGDAWVGAVTTALLFDIGSLLLSTLLGHTRGSVYGTATSVLALLAWVYYSAQVFFFGAALTRIFATTHGGGIVPVHRALGRGLWRRVADRRSAQMLLGKRLHLTHSKSLANGAPLSERPEFSSRQQSKRR
jgi:membrane protein